MMIHPTRNLNLHEKGRGKRGGTSHVNSTTVSGTPQIVGLHDFTLKNGNQFLVVATGDGKLYKNFTETIKTGLGINLPVWMVPSDDTLFFCNGYNRPQTWDGSAASTSDITSIPADWSGTNFPKQMIIHGRGASERMWAVGCPSNIYEIYASENADFKDFSDGNVITLKINVGDGYGIVGAVEFGDRLICFSKRKAYVIDDSDTDTSNWGWQAAQWEGGVGNHRLIVRTPNDIVCMMEDGTIFSVLAAQEYGDYRSASLTKPSDMDKWIKDNIRLSEIDKFHGIYDPVMRAIKYFVIRNGETQADTALVYFVDRGPQEGWMVHDNKDYASGYSASSSCVFRKSVDGFKVYTGDYSGFVWELERANKNDNNNAYYGGWLDAPNPFDNPRTTKKYKRGWLVTQPEGNYNVSIKTFIDGVEQSTETVLLSGAGGILGSFILGTSALGGREILVKPYDLGYVGNRIQTEVFNSNANEDFYISKTMTDFKELGAKPQ